MSMAGEGGVARAPSPFARRREYLRKLPVLQMAQETLEGIANQSFGGGSATLTWETATDWDNAAAEKSVVHEGYGDLPGTDVIQLGYTGPVGASHHPLHEDSGSTAQDQSGNNRDATINGATLGNTGIVNTTSFGFNGSDAYLDTGADYAAGGTALAAFGYVNPDTTHNGKIVAKDDDNNGRSFNLALNSDGTCRWEVHYDNGNTDVWDFGSYTTGSWQFIGGSFDGSTQYGYVDGSQYSQSAAGSQVNGSTTSVTIGRRNYSGAENYYDGLIAHPHVFTSHQTDSEMQAYYEAAVSGYLTTATKSFGSATAPDLQNLSYSLNSQSITLDVIGSPGTASEEIVSQTLDGSTSYNLSWSNTHTDFRIKPNVSTTDPTTSPTFSRGELVAP